MENSTEFSMEVTVGNKDLNNLIGFLELDLYNYQAKGTKISGGRLDICKMVTTRLRPSLLSFLYEGIQQTENNLPRKCPFKRVSQTIG